MALAFAARAREKWIFVVFVAFVAAILEDLASSIQTISLHKQVAKSSPNGILSLQTIARVLHNNPSGMVIAGAKLQAAMLTLLCRSDSLRLYGSMPHYGFPSQGWCSSAE